MTTHELLLTIALAMTPWVLRGQDYPTREIDPERLADEIFPAQTLDLNYSELYENLLQRLSDPLDLNRASAEEIRSLFILREEQVEAFLSYRAITGPLLSVLEIQAVPGIDLQTVRRLMPFVRVEDSATHLDQSLLTRVLAEKSYAILRYERTLEEKKGYHHETPATQRYYGSPDKLYFRFRSSRPGDFSFGVTAEKDAGEPITWNPAKHYNGLDYYSFHGQVVNKGRVRNLILGDYQAQFGQGLVLGGGFGMGKGSDAISAIRRSTLGFIPYTSINEFGFFRGAALSYNLGRNLILHAFESSQRIDGNIIRDSTSDDASLISSFATTGYHRTAVELKSRKQIQENDFGAVFHYHRGALESGVLFQQTYFQVPIVRSPTPYNQFAFGGLRNTNASAFLNYSRNNLTFFSEAAHTLFHGSAIIAGVLGSLTPQLDMSFVYRYFARNFQGLHGNAVAENSTAQNELGSYWGVKYALNRQFFVSGYVDLFRFPWLRYRGYAPSDGSEWLLRFNFQPSRSVLIFMQAREESKIRNLPTNGTLYQTANGIKRNYWINCDYAIAPHLSMKTRVQWSTYGLAGKTTSGMVIMQDVALDFGRLSFSAREALFDTDDYDNRLYAYERDVWLSYSFPAYFGVGIRQFILVQYRLSQSIDIWIRWAHTRYTDRTEIGTGSETINGNTQNDVKLQARIRL